MKNQLFIQETVKRTEFPEDERLIVLDGKSIQNLKEFYATIEKVFHFPSSCHDNMDGFLDWICDLWWIPEDKINLVIENQQEFLKQDILARQDIIECFRDYILPFWEYEVLDCVVGGECKKFMVYLVDKLV